MASTAATLLKEAQLTPLPSLASPSSLAHQTSVHETQSIQLQWPSGRAASGFLADKPKLAASDEDFKHDSAMSSKKKQLVFSPSFGSLSRNQTQSHDSQASSIKKVMGGSKHSSGPLSMSQIVPESTPKTNSDTDSQCKTPLVLPMKRKLSELKDAGSSFSVKRLHSSDHGVRSPICPTPNGTRKGGLLNDTLGFSTPCSNLRDQRGRSIPNVSMDYLDENQHGNYHVGQVTPSSQPGFVNDTQPSNSERLTLDSIVVQYLKHQHRQCPAPITTLPPLSLLQPHVCPEPKRSLDAPSNVTARIGTRELRSVYGVHGNRKDRQFVYSRFRPWRTCRDDACALFTCLTFLGDSSRIAVGSHTNELKIFDSNSNSMLDSCTSHQSPLTLIQSYLSGETQLLLSSSAHDVCLWDASSISGGPMHSFEGCKAARFSRGGNIFAALPTDFGQREILLYDLQTCQLESRLSDTSGYSTGRGHAYSQIHFSPSDTMLLWNGVLWDRRNTGPIHRFDQFTDYGGGGFHPAGNEVNKPANVTFASCTSLNAGIL